MRVVEVVTSAHWSQERGRTHILTRSPRPGAMPIASFWAQPTGSSRRFWPRSASRLARCITEPIRLSCLNPSRLDLAYALINVDARAVGPAGAAHDADTRVAPLCVWLVTG